MDFVSVLKNKSYGRCRSKNCGIPYDLLEKDFVEDLSCRHTLYVKRGELYRGDFRDAGDYCLVLALYNHIDATNTYSMPSHSLPEVFSGKFTIWCSLKDVMIWDEETPQSLIHLALVSLQRESNDSPPPYTFGYLSARTGIHHGFIIPAPEKTIRVIVEVSNISPPDPDYTVGWHSEDNLFQQMSRFRATKNPRNKYLLEKLAQRTINPVNYETLFSSCSLKQSKWFRTKFDHLNDHQQQALRAILLQNGVVPISAPFGCGKTELIAIAAAAYLKLYPERRVVIFAETNEAVYTNLVRAAKIFDGWRYDDLLRIGDKKEIVDEFSDYSLTAKLARFEKQWLEDHNWIKSGLRKALDEEQTRLLKAAKVVFSTNSSLGKHDLRKLQFHLCINDEAGQTPDAGLIMALRDDTKTVVIIGDQRQLRPFRRGSDTQQKETYYNGGFSHGLNNSVLEDFCDKGLHIWLNIQHRCHRKIMDILQAFYPFEITTGKKFREPGLLNGMRVLRDCAIERQRALLVNLKNGREDGEKNYAEAQWIIEKFQSIARHKKQKWSSTEPKWSVFVITPYQAQLKLLIDLLRRSYYEWNEELHVKCCMADELEVRCLTADSCQGKETAISLISMVRTDKVGFLDTPNRILTMLSRASDYLMIVAHRSTFEADPLWRILLRRMELCKALMYDDDASYYRLQ